MTNYSYDELLRLSTLWNYNYTYNTQWNITNDWKDSYTYDILWRLTSVNYDKVNTPGYNWDKIERFSYDNVWNRTNQENYTLKETSTETCSDETVVEDITLPNWKTKTVEKKVRKCETAITQTEKQKNTLTYNTNSLNQYTKLQNLNKNGEVKKEFTYNYDKNWNLTKDDINQYFYDYKNRLVKVIQNEVIKVDENWNILETIPEKEIVKYSYDVLGRRIEKKTQDKTTQFIYAGQNVIKEFVFRHSELDSESILTETRQNIYSNNLDDILSTIITNYTTETPIIKQYFYEKNHLWSVTKITDTNWAIIEQYEYDAFWTAYANVNNVEAVTEAQDNKTLNIKEAEWSETDSEWNSDEITINNIRYKRYNGVWKIGNTRLYTGREYDAELKLYYLRARYYSPDLGRFISRDPIDVRDDVNLYAYVGNNGVMFVDRRGLAKDAIINMYRKSWKEMSDYRKNSDINFIKNDFDINLNIIYFYVEFSWFWARWYYDLAFFWDWVILEEDKIKANFEETNQFNTSIKWVYDCKWQAKLCDGYLTFGWDELSIWQISNVLTALNAYRLWFTQEHLEFWAMTTVMIWAWNWIEWELADRILYDYWYNLWKLEEQNWWLTDEEIVKYIKEAIIARENYLNNK